MEKLGMMLPLAPSSFRMPEFAAKSVSAQASRYPMTTPRMPPVMHSAEDSARNWAVISRLLAPSARRMPISRMRSVTLVSIMFMMPMPPTKSEMPATAPMMSENEPIKEFMASIALFIELTMTSPLSSSPLSPLNS